MGTYQTLRDNLYTLLNTLKTSGVLQEVHQYPTLEFNGYPAIMINPSGNEGDYLTQAENKRLYKFNVWIFQEFDQLGIPKAIGSLMDSVDSIVNLIEKEDSPDTDRTLDDNLPDGYTLVSVKPTFADVQQDLEAKTMFVQVIVRCYVTVDLTLIS